MAETYLMHAARYVELNPVRAKLCRVPWRWPWSSAAAHLAGRDDELVRVRPLLERVGSWREFLSEGVSAEEAELFRQHERTGRPLGQSRFLDCLEKALGRTVRPIKPGPKVKKKES
jgi:putative transposase